MEWGTVEKAVTALGGLAAVIAIVAFFKEGGKVPVYVYQSTTPPTAVAGTPPGITVVPATPGPITTGPAPTITETPKDTTTAKPTPPPPPPQPWGCLYGGSPHACPSGTKDCGAWCTSQQGGYTLWSNPSTT